MKHSRSEDKVEKDKRKEEKKKEKEREKEEKEKEKEREKEEKAKEKEKEKEKKKEREKEKEKNKEKDKKKWNQADVENKIENQVPQRQQLKTSPLARSPIATHRDSGQITRERSRHDLWRSNSSIEREEIERERDTEDIPTWDEAQDMYDYVERNEEDEEEEEYLFVALHNEREKNRGDENGIGEDKLDLKDSLGVSNSAVFSSKLLKTLVEDGATTKINGIERHNITKNQLDLTDEQFNAVTYLSVFHCASHFKDLIEGGRQLQIAIKRREQSIRKLVALHFEAFVKTRASLDDIQAEVNKLGAVEQDGMLKCLVDTFQGILGDMNNILLPLLAKEKDASNLRKIIEIADANNSFVSILSSFNKNIQTGNYDGALFNYKQLEDTQGPTIMKKLCQKYSTYFLSIRENILIKLQDKGITNEKEKHAVRVVRKLTYSSERDPIISLIYKNFDNMKEMLEDYKNALKESTEMHDGQKTIKLKKENKKMKHLCKTLKRGLNAILYFIDLYFTDKNIIRVKSAMVKKDAQELLLEQLYHAQYGVKRKAIKKKNKVFMNAFRGDQLVKWFMKNKDISRNDAISNCQDLAQKGLVILLRMSKKNTKPFINDRSLYSLKSMEESHLEELPMTPRNAHINIKAPSVLAPEATQIEHQLESILTKFSAMVLDLFFAPLEERVTLEEWLSFAHTCITYVSKVRHKIAPKRVVNLKSMQVVLNYANSKMVQLITDMSKQYCKTCYATTLYSAAILHGRDEWNLVAVEGGSVTQICDKFSEIVTKTFDLLKPILFVIDKEQAIDDGEWFVQTFLKISDTLHHLGFNVKLENINTDFELDSPDQLIVLLMNNCAYIRDKLFPQLLTSFSNIYKRAVTPVNIATVKETFTVLENMLYHVYLRKKVTSMKSILKQGILDVVPRLELLEEPPTMRPYILQVVSELVRIHAEVNRVNRAWGNKVLVIMTQDILSTFGAMVMEYEVSVLGMRQFIFEFLFIETSLEVYANREQSRTINKSMREKLTYLMEESDREYDVDYDEDMLDRFLRKEMQKTKAVFSCFIDY